MSYKVMLCLYNTYMKYLIKEMLSYKSQDLIEVLTPQNYSEILYALKNENINIIFIDKDELIHYKEIKAIAPQTTVIKLIGNVSGGHTHKDADRILTVPFTYDELMNSLFDSGDFTPFNPGNICYDLLIRSVEFCKSTIVAFEKCGKAVYMRTYLDKKPVNKTFSSLEKDLNGLFFRTMDNKLINISMIKTIKNRKDYYLVVLNNSDITGIVEISRIDELVKRVYI